MVPEVQAKILAKIAGSDGMRYSEAYPGEEIDDDLYNYHLQEMVKRGLLTKENSIYKLTNKGKQEVTYINSNGDDLGRFKVITILVVTRNNNKEILVQKRNRHPHRGEISTISGRVMVGEKVVEAAKRRLKEEAGLEANFEHWGDFRAIRKTANGKLFEDIIFCICKADEPTGELVSHSEYGENWWDKFDKIFEYLNDDVAVAKIEKIMLAKIKNNKKSGAVIEEEEIILTDY